jgi:uncharacterized NAD(P)/FAD-binding protein YdhS
LFLSEVTLQTEKAGTVPERKGMSDRSTQSHYDIAIVGGGFSGAVLAAHLLRHSSGGESIAIINKEHSLGRGVAYSTECIDHLLNARAGDMSAWPDQGNHFLEWLRTERDPSTHPDQFVSRSAFGQYAESVLASSIQERPDVTVSCITEEAVHALPNADGIHLRTHTGREIHARFVVFATGNYPPADPPQIRNSSPGRYVSYAWSAGALDGVGDLQSVLLIGTGLTAVDQILAIRARKFRGNISLLSRHGILPNTHTSRGGCWSRSWTTSLPATLRPLLSVVRKEISKAVISGSNWQDVFDSMRPESTRIWQSLSTEDQKRFLRHVRPYWDSHRHRIPPEVYRNLKDWIDKGDLRILAGRLVEYQENDAGAQVTFRDRHTGTIETLQFDRVINCTGNNSSEVLAKTALFKSLIESGTACIDRLKLGLDVSENAALLDTNGQASSRLFAIGPLQRGCLWETTAVPEIRSQAASLAQRLLHQCGALTATA